MASEILWEKARSLIVLGVTMAIRKGFASSATGSSVFGASELHPANTKTAINKIESTLKIFFILISLILRFPGLVFNPPAQRLL